MRWFGVVLLVLWAREAAGARYAFFRSLNLRGGRRVFGGSDMRSSWPGACALLDRNLAAHCSCAVLSPRWALTAAHCAVPSVAYVQYNIERKGKEMVSVLLLYAHPEFKAVQKDQGAGMDVVTLHHDIGMVRTRTDMKVPREAFFPLPLRSGPRDLVERMSAHDVRELIGEEIDVLGYGMTEQGPSGERLREVRLRLVACDREDWWNCACALGYARGVCAGDSGGPVLYNGAQIGVTSMGPIECGTEFGTGVDLALSVFTELKPYAELIDSTMRDVDTQLKMRSIPYASAAERNHFQVALCSASLLLCRTFHFPQELLEPNSTTTTSFPPSMSEDWNSSHPGFVTGSKTRVKSDLFPIKQKTLLLLHCIL